jgi:hypothetical protein
MVGGGFLPKLIRQFPLLLLVLCPSPKAVSPTPLTDLGISSSEYQDPPFESGGCRLCIVILLMVVSILVITSLSFSRQHRSLFFSQLSQTSSRILA